MCPDLKNLFFLPKLQPKTADEWRIMTNNAFSQSAHWCVQGQFLERPKFDAIVFIPEQLHCLLPETWQNFQLGISTSPAILFLPPGTRITLTYDFCGHTRKFGAQSWYGLPKGILNKIHSKLSECGKYLQPKFSSVRGAWTISRTPKIQSNCFHCRATALFIAWNLTEFPIRHFYLACSTFSSPRHRASH